MPSNNDSPPKINIRISHGTSPVEFGNILLTRSLSPELLHALQREPSGLASKWFTRVTVELGHHDVAWLARIR